MNATAEVDPRALETAVRFVARIFAEELVRAYRASGTSAVGEQPAVDRPVVARPGVEPGAGQPPVEQADLTEAPTPEPPAPVRRFGLRPPDAIADGEPFGPALLFLEEQALAVRELFGGAASPPAAPLATAEPTIADVFALGPRRRGAPENELEVFP